MNHADHSAHNAMAARAVSMPRQQRPLVHVPSSFWPEPGEWGIVRILALIDIALVLLLFYLIWRR